MQPAASHVANALFQEEIKIIYQLLIIYIIIVGLMGEEEKNLEKIRLRQKVHNLVKSHPIDLFLNMLIRIQFHIRNIPFTFLANFNNLVFQIHSDSFPMYVYSAV